jgi:TolB-like protein/Tfp pilus assembly protein PilF
MGKIRNRGIIGAVATFAGSGWLTYEIIHFILVEHYHLPEQLKDITIVSVLCAMLCNLAWRWFRGEKKPRKPKWEKILIPVFILAAAAVNLNFLLHLTAHDTDPRGEVTLEGRWKSSIAVLPFVNISADREQEYFCDGLTEEMITKLSQVRELKVTARTSAFAFKGENKDIREVGRKLGVDKVLEGSVRKEGSRLRISAQLINVSDGFHLWSDTYDREMDKVFMIQDDIARSVAGALKVTLLGERVFPSQTKDYQAYNEYLLGRYFYSNPTKENAEKAIGHYEEAIRMDPDYARAWAGLAAAQAAQASFGYVPTEEGFHKALASVTRALDLDDRLAHAYSILGFIQMTHDWDWTGAEASFEKAMDLETGRGMLDAAQLSLAKGRFERALVLARRASELDSFNATAKMNFALTLFYAGRLDEASDYFREVLNLSPTRANAHALLGQVDLFQSRFDEALADAEQEMDPFWRLPVESMAYHSLRRKPESDAALAQFVTEYKDVGAYQIAQVHAYRGDTKLAFEWLETAFSQHDGGLYLSKADPFLKRLSEDPRYNIFLKKVGLPLD